MKSIPQQVSESVRRRNPHLYRPCPPDRDPMFWAEDEAVAHQKPPKPTKRIRQSSKPLMNKLECEFADVLFARYGQFGYPVWAQSIRFKLGNGIWYKPDFVVFGETGMMAFEVKGPFAHRGGFENLKVAAHLFCKNLHWWLVWKVADKWFEQEVLP